MVIIVIVAYRAYVEREITDLVDAGSRGPDHVPSSGRRNSLADCFADPSCERFFIVHFDPLRLIAMHVVVN